MSTLVGRGVYGGRSCRSTPYFRDEKDRIIGMAVFRLEGHGAALGRECRSMRTMGPPHRGQIQSGSAASGVDCDAPECPIWSCVASSRRHSGNKAARRRCAKNPKCRIRTNPGGRTCRRKRRTNSATGKVINRFLFPWAESRQRRVTRSCASETSRWLEIATRCV